MTKDYGIKVSRPGYDVKSAEPNQLSFSSAYKTLKVLSSGSGTITDSTRTITIAHNLGYVPLFMVHTEMNLGFGSSLFSSGDYVLAPAGLSGVLTDPTVGTSDDLFAYADTTNLYIKAQSNFGYLMYRNYPSDLNKSTANNSSVLGYLTGYWAVGNETSLGSEDGAIRFGPVALSNSQSIYKATLSIYITGRTGSGQVISRVYGIDEDNTGEFDGGTGATARSKTDAYTQWNTGLSAGDTNDVNVKTDVEEIIARAGWSSGNAMGFIMIDNGTSSGNDYFGGTNSVLKILTSSNLANYKYTIFYNQLE